MEATARQIRMEGIEWMEPPRYTPYLLLLKDAFERLLVYYREAEREANTTEAESLALFVQKMISTVTALRFRHAFSPTHFQRPGVDLADSGFPHFHDIIKLDSDLAARDERLPKLPDLDVSREMLLEHLMQPGIKKPVRESEAFRRLQWQFAERVYFESLNLREQFFRFTPGKLFSLEPGAFATSDGRRAYQFSWGCYDPMRNRPCVYFMLVEQDHAEKPLDTPNNPEYERFLQQVDSIASRAPIELLPIAVRLDEALHGLYVKALKRVCFGPLVSPLLWNGEAEMHSKLAIELMPLFTQASLDVNDFVLFYSKELIIAEREEGARSLKSTLGFDKGVRQIFSVPKNVQHRRRQASAYQDYCILPHRFRQHLTDDVRARTEEFVGQNLIMLAYQKEEKGVTNVG